jgi:2-polyprenyl-3-methyl-5-hydroxy-6-metoxy-1,4-benzoquinol methylase
VSLDPFSPAFRQVCEALYTDLANVQDYDPLVNERTPYVDLTRTVSSPTPYQYGDSTIVADFMLSWGWVLRNLDVRAGARVLEYGAGEGQLSIQLARMGCEVAIVLHSASLN